MYREMHNAGLPDPEHKAISFMLHAIIRNRNCIKADTINGDYGGLNGGLTPYEFQVYQFLKNTPAATAPMISDSLSISLRSVERAVQKLKERNLIQRIGSKKTGHWKVL